MFNFFFLHQAEIECHDNGDGSALVKYHPSVPGDYAVHILCDNDDIPHSPYISHILPKSNYHPELVKCTGLGVEPNAAFVGKTCEFIIDVKSAGVAPLHVKVSFTHLLWPTFSLAPYNTIVIYMSCAACTYPVYIYI